MLGTAIHRRRIEVAVSILFSRDMSYLEFQHFLRGKFRSNSRNFRDRKIIGMSDAGFIRSVLNPFSKPQPFDALEKSLQYRQG